MAGPWFTVHQNGGDWQPMGEVWISNGESDSAGVLEIRVELLQPTTAS